MSRIEEALRRAVDGGPRPTAAVDETVPVGWGDPQLARYPLENKEPARPPVAEPVARRRSAPPPSRTDIDSTAFPETLEGKLILNDAEPFAVEQYRRLAAAVHHLQSTQGTKVLMVASARPREGKTLTVTNLALTLSESYGRRVLLIDADLRKPSIHEIFRLPNAKGLSDGLRSESGELSVLPVTPLLSVLPAGRADANPMAGLTSERMRVLLSEAATAFDWVLLDAPPVGIMPDAHLLARLTEGVILVIAAGSTPFDLVDRAVSEIGRDNIVGTVLNRIDPQNVQSTGYYDDYYKPATT
jgi:capsular exopolysaccharide synthesis family protein